MALILRRRDTKRNYFFYLTPSSSNESSIESPKRRILVLELHLTVARFHFNPSRIPFVPETRMGLELSLT
jgi:hypothetical protein